MRHRIVLAWGLALVLVLVACTDKAEETTTTSTTAPAATTATTQPPVRTGIGVGDGVITLAALLPLSGTLETFGRSVLEGHEVYWEYVNGTLGGVGGQYLVAPIALDTAYDEDTARSLWVANQDGMLAISSVLGSPITAALLAEIGSQQILVAAGSQASSWSTSPNVVLDLALPTYRDQIAGAITAGGAEQPVVKATPPLGLLYQEGVYGEDCLAGFDQATSRMPPDAALSVVHPGSATEFAEDVAVMQEAGVETLFVCSSNQAFLRIVATLDLLDYSPIVVASSQAYDASIPAALGDQGGESTGLELLSRVYLVGSWPAFEGDLPGMKLLQDNFVRYDSRLPEEVIDPWFFVGYTQAATFHLILEEALSGGDLTRAGVWAARDRIGDVDFGFGAGPARYDQDRVPMVADVFSVPVSASEALFGMTPVGTYYSTR